MKYITTKISVCAFALFLTFSSTAQNYLVDWDYLGRKTVAEMFLIFFQQVDHDVDLYKLTYNTTGIDNLPDTASGLAAIPVVPEESLLPIVVFQHGTTSGPTDVPSMLRGGYEAPMGYAGMGFITFAADFLGLGDSRGFHPYLHAATEASAALDMLNAGLEFLELYPENKPQWNPNFLFVSGYSQGGHASMALHREIDKFWSFVYPVTAATHMSGPYDLSGTMRNLILADVDYQDPAYIAYIALGLQAVYGNLYTSIDEVFKEPYAAAIDSFANRFTTLGTLNGRLLHELGKTGNLYTWRMFQDDFLDAFTNDPEHPFQLALEENDVYQWAPEAPTRLYYCSGDEQVPYQNSLVAVAAMNALGAPDVVAEDFGALLNHSLCVLPSALSSISFFRSFLESSSTLSPTTHPEILSVYPNPAMEEIYVLWENALEGMDWKLYTITGQLVDAGKGSDNRIILGDLESGMYVLTVTADGETRTGRFVKL